MWNAMQQDCAVFTEPVNSSEVTASWLAAISLRIPFVSHSVTNAAPLTCLTQA